MIPAPPGRRPFLLPLLLILSELLLFAPACHAAGPRWVSGFPYYAAEGFYITWYTPNPQYFTDPGDLSPYVNHAAADALVSAAAQVWNVPTANIDLSYGGSLSQHVSSANIAFSGNGLTFPFDVQSSNYFNKQIAVLYDSDGSIIDLMLGSGASSPSSCRQNAVLESVDSISNVGKILHAVLILNGRCTGPAPEQQLQLQYQLMRAFGRVLGLAWSQTNDNVFTGNPRPTSDQALHWPIMHPIDIICGPYTYQCLPQPFTLRDDDLAALGMLYTVGNPGQPAAGKTDTLAVANRVQGSLNFPNGQGMQGVNVVVHRLQAFWNIPEPWETTSSVSGFRFRRRSATPFQSLTSSATGNMGSITASWEGEYDLFRIPLYGVNTWDDLIVSTQPVNPLYVGPYAVGPYDTNSVAPSGSSQQKEQDVVQAYGQPAINITVPDAAPGCSTPNDGIETAPAFVATTGWWNGNLCSYGHTAWSTLSVRANRSLTFEVTALNEGSISTSAKAMPVIGLWNSSDPTGTPPTLDSTPTAFNSDTIGLTTLTTSTAQARQLRIAIFDQRGDGRPDYLYNSRVLYADTVSPTSLPAEGGTVTITGMGFRAGNVVTVNGRPANVTSITTNTILADVPSPRAHSAIVADVAVGDLVTGGVATMFSALSFAAPQPKLELVSAPSGTVFTNIPTAVPLSVEAIEADGVTPLANTSITLSATAGQVLFAACGQPTCTFVTNSSGVVSSAVIPLADGTITLSATSTLGTVTASFSAFTQVQTITASLPVIYLAEGAVLSWTPQATLSDNSASPTGVSVLWTALSGPIGFSPATSISDAQAIAQTSATAGPLAGNTQAIAQACAWSSLCASLTFNGVAAPDLRLQATSGAQQTPDAPSAFTPVTLTVTDTAGHSVAGAEVVIHQTVSPWLPPCPDAGRCPIPPVYEASTLTLVSGLDGTIIFAPLELPGPSGQAEVTDVAAAVGTEGFLSFALERRP